MSDSDDGISVRSGETEFRASDEVATHIADRTFEAFIALLDWAERSPVLALSFAGLIVLCVIIGRREKRRERVELERLRNDYKKAAEKARADAEKAVADEGDDASPPLL